jgi:hypothetical protein
MLHISHHQTTAYHPESNGAVERLHCHLKDVLCEQVAASTWSKELPFVLLGLRAQLREDTGLSTAEAVYGAPFVLPNEFLQGDEFSVDAIVKKFKKNIGCSSFPSPGTIPAPSCQLSCQTSCCALFISLRHSGITPPLHRPYDNPYAVLRHRPYSFSIRVRSRDKIVSVSRLKACTEVDVTPGSLQRRS